MTIRIIQPQELAVLEAIAKDCFGSSAWSQKQYLQRIESERSLVVGLFEPELCGYAVYSQVLDEAELLQIAVAPLQQQHGYAQQLLSYAHRYLQKAGVTQIMLEVRASNQAAINLYYKCGFAPDGVRKNYYPLGQEGAREDAQLMTLTLDNCVTPCKL